MKFPDYADHSGAASVAAFSIRPDIAGAQIWTTALVLMAFGQVLARVGDLQARRLTSGGAAPEAAQTDRRRAGRYASRPAE